MRTSDAINELAAALAAAHGEMENPHKGRTASVESKRTGAKFTYSYADIADVLNGSRAVLAKHGLCIVQGFSIEGNAMTMQTRIMHSSGQYIEDDFPVCQLPASPQDIGSAITYARRYAYSPKAGIAAEDDTDAQESTVKAQGRPDKPANVKQAAKEAQAPAGPDVALMLRKLSSCTDMAELVAMWKDAAFQADFKRASEADQARLNAKKEEAKAVLSDAIFDRPGEAA